MERIHGWNAFRFFLLTTNIDRRIEKKSAACMVCIALSPFYCRLRRIRLNLDTDPAILDASLTNKKLSCRGDTVRRSISRGQVRVAQGH